MLQTDMIRAQQVDAPFWAFMLFSVVCLGSIGCFGLAAAQDGPHAGVIMTTDNVPPPADLR